MLPNLEIFLIINRLIINKEEEEDRAFPTLIPAAARIFTKKGENLSTLMQKSSQIWKTHAKPRHAGEHHPTRSRPSALCRAMTSCANGALFSGAL